MAKKKRKTREEKIIADLRRELQTARRELKDTNQEEKPKKSSKEAPPATTEPHPYLKKDLTKSLILAIMAIAFELVVYWTYFKTNISLILPGGKFKFF